MQGPEHPSLESFFRAVFGVSNLKVWDNVTLQNKEQVCLLTYSYKRDGFLSVPQLQHMPTNYVAFIWAHPSCLQGTWQSKANQHKHEAHAACYAMSNKALCL